LSTEATPHARLSFRAIAARIFVPRTRPSRRQAWEEDALTRIASMARRATLVHETTELDERTAAALAYSIGQHLEAARKAAEGRTRVSARASGADVARVNTNLRAAEEALLELANRAQLRGELPYVQARLAENLPREHPQRRAAEAVIGQRGGELDERERAVIVSAFREANAEAGRKLARVRSFRNLIIVATFVLALAAGGLALVGAVKPSLLPICFQPGTGQVCATGTTPQSADIAVVQLVGMLGAAVAAVTALRRERGTAMPFFVPVVLGLLKLPMGALSAVLGLLLIHGQIVPGLGALDSTGQIIAWAILLGAGQQIFMRLIDQQGGHVLDDARPMVRHASSGDR
jgi:hypothetical protein